MCVKKHTCRFLDGVIKMKLLSQYSQKVRDIQLLGEQKANNSGWVYHKKENKGCKKTSLNVFL